jgi:nuclear transport factor 2 (NTF2) superfamily protein
VSPRPPFPPFTEQTARQKVQAGEDAWNTRDPERVALAYTEDSVWRNRIALRFQYESRDAAGQWFRSYGNELWEFTDEGLMRRREASINDMPIDPADRRIHGPRPEAEHGAAFPLR